MRHASSPAIRASRETPAPPAGMPPNIRPVTAARRPGGATSAATETRLANTPPKPSPAQEPRGQQEVEAVGGGSGQGEGSESDDRGQQDGLRPQRSAAQPPSSAPSNRPMLAALPAKPIWPGLSPSSGARRAPPPRTPGRHTPRAARSARRRRSHSRDSACARRPLSSDFPATRALPRCAPGDTA